MSGGTTSTILSNLEPDKVYSVAVVPVYPDVEGIREQEKGKTSESPLPSPPGSPDLPSPAPASITTKWTGSTGAELQAVWNLLLRNMCSSCWKVESSSAPSGGAAALPVPDLKPELQQSHSSGSAPGGHLTSWSDVFQSRWVESRTCRSPTPPPTPCGSTGSLPRATSDTTTSSTCRLPEGRRAWWVSWSPATIFHLVLTHLVLTLLSHCCLTDSGAGNVHQHCPEGTAARH